MECTEFKREVEALFRSISDKLAEILRDFYEPYGITASQAMILIALHRDGPGKISDIARSLHMTNSNLSVICRRLEKAGFLIRKRDDLDQRVVYLYLTDQCKELMQRLEQNLTTGYLCTLEDASEDDKDIIIKGLSKLSDLLNHNG